MASCATSDDSSHLHGFCVNLFIFKLTPWSTLLLEKIRVAQLIKDFEAFYGTWKFITMFTKVRFISLLSAR
jgi:hypothetical protein